MLLSMTETLGKLAKTGQRPRRTIKVCHWDAEEPGVIGSAEWSEQFRDELTQKAVAYMNYDAAVSGRTFGASASPSMKKLIIEATQSVQYPDSNKTVYQHWMGHKAQGSPTRVTGSSAPAVQAGDLFVGQVTVAEKDDPKVRRARRCGRTRFQDGDHLDEAVEHGVQELLHVLERDPVPVLRRCHARSRLDPAPQSDLRPPHSRSFCTGSTPQAGSSQCLTISGRSPDG